MNKQADFFALAIVAGILPLLWIVDLDRYVIHTLCASLVGLLLWIILALRGLRRYRLAVTLFCLGSLSALWSAYYAQRYLHEITPYIDTSITATVTVTSLGFPETLSSFSQAVYTTVDADSINGEPVHPPISLRVIFPDESHPQAGERWRIQMKTKVVHAELNDGGFDAQRFYLARRSLLVGTLKTAERLSSERSLRQQIADRFFQTIDTMSYADVVLALGLGDRTLLTETHKTILRQSGVIHLLAISGMHIVLVYLFTLLMLRTLFRRLRLLYGIYEIPIALAWLAALFYGLLTGMSPPTMRALLALTLWIALKQSGLLLSHWQRLLFTVTLLLVYDPLMVLSESFWLSFYAVFTLLFLIDWFPWRPSHPLFQSAVYRYMGQLFYLQCGLTLLLLPMQSYLFQGVATLSLLANLIAIPWVTFVIFPLILLLLLLASCEWFTVSQWLASICDEALHLLFLLLQPLSRGWWDMTQAMIPWTVLSWIVLILFRYHLLIYALGAIALLLLSLGLSTISTKRDGWRIDMLDVGHGLAVVITSNGRSLLYDTGASTETSSKAARSIVPFLKWHGWSLDGVIISHEHNDHIGGLPTMRALAPTAWVMSSSSSIDQTFECIAGRVMQWQQLTLTVIWPERLHAFADNDASCVVHVTDGTISVLLTGDLEAKQEQALVAQSSPYLNVDILQVPHHGSRTSSTYAFLGQVDPQLAVISASRYNPWKLPAQSRLDRYEELNIPVAITSETGQITLEISGDQITVSRYRYEIKPRWYHDWFGEKRKKE